MTFPTTLDHWQKAELLHNRFSLLKDAARNYALYAELYSRQGNVPKFYECKARAEELHSLAVTHHLFELHQWQLAHQYKMSSKKSQLRLRRSFSLMAKAYIFSCVVWCVFAVLQ